MQYQVLVKPLRLPFICHVILMGLHFLIIQILSLIDLLRKLHMLTEIINTIN